LRTFVVLSVPILFFGPVLSAAVLYETTPIGSSVRNADYAISSESGFRVFDDFTIASGGTIEKITWRGMYLDLSKPDPAPAPTEDIESWRLSFHADDAGLPGAQLLVATLQAADVTSTFQGTALFNAGGTYRASFYEYSAVLPVTFQSAAGTKYWFGILGISPTSNPLFAIRGASGGDGF
jgi:hypothetical protein